ncbi:MAG: hypothetical protein LBN27_01935 [Prevotellaceae bacterium]|jgi:hypothetical protein|nr:hypothetical protein [Prevotellaceae bacterium]
MSKFIQLTSGGERRFVNLSSISLIKESEGKSMIIFSLGSPNERSSALEVDLPYDKLVSLIERV